MKNLGLTRESVKVSQFLKCMLIMLRFMKIWVKKQTWKKSETTRLLLLTLVFAHKVFPPLPRSTMVSQKSLLNLKMAAIFQWKWILFPVLQTLPNVVYIYFRNICMSRSWSRGLESSGINISLGSLGSSPYYVNTCRVDCG